MKAGVEPREMSPESLMVVESEWLAHEDGAPDDYGDHGEDVKALIAHVKWLERAQT